MVNNIILERRVCWFYCSDCTTVLFTPLVFAVGEVADVCTAGACCRWKQQTSAWFTSLLMFMYTLQIACLVIYFRDTGQNLNSEVSTRTCTCHVTHISLSALHISCVTSLRGEYWLAFDRFVPAHRSPVTILMNRISTYISDWQVIDLIPVECLYSVRLTLVYFFSLLCDSTVAVLTCGCYCNFGPNYRCCR